MTWADEAMQRLSPRYSVGPLVAALLAFAGPVLTAPAAATDRFEDVPVIVAAVNAVLESAPTGSVNPWENPATGTQGTIIIEKTYFRADEIPCRDYTRRTEGAAPTVTRGTGCRDHVGLWRLTETAPVAAVPPPEPATATSAAAAPPEQVRLDPAAETAVLALPKPRSKPRLISGSMPSRSN